MIEEESRVIVEDLDPAEAAAEELVIRKRAERVNRRLHTNRSYTVKRDGPPTPDGQGSSR